jgi:hypothetical protein
MAKAEAADAVDIPDGISRCARSPPNIARMSVAMEPTSPR